MDIRDESFIELHQTDEGISYSIYAPDFTLTDGGVWEMEESMSLLTAAAEILATTSNALAEVEDYNHFMALVDMDASFDIPAELAQLKVDILANIQINRQKLSTLSIPKKKKQRKHRQKQSLRRLL